MYKILMITSITILAIGWIAYGVWRYRENQAEKNQKGPKTEHLQKVRKSFDDYIQQMKSFKRKTH